MVEKYGKMNQEELAKALDRIEWIIWDCEMADRMDERTTEKWRNACRERDYIRGLMNK